jgi:hypothetical protein
MKKQNKWLWLLLSVMLSTQITKGQDSLNLRPFLKAKIAQLNKAKVTTNYLYDQIPVSTYPHFYAGVQIDSLNLDAYNYRQLVFQHVAAKLNNENFLNDYKVIDSINDVYFAQNKIAINLLSNVYQKIRADAVDSGYIGYDKDSNFVSNTDTSLNPYTAFNVFAAGTWSPAYSGINQQFIIPSSLFIKNITDQIQKIEYKINNSEWARAYFDQGFELTFADSGLKTMSIKMTYANGNIFQVGFNFFIGKKANDLAYDTLKTITAQIDFTNPCGGNTNSPLPRNKARYYVKFADTNKSGKIKKPFIFVEGIDFDYTDYLPIQNNGRYGEFGWDVFVSGGWYPNGFPKNYKMGQVYSEGLQLMPSMIQSYLAQGYDVILVDFEKGADYIQKNAFALIEVINQINIEKIGNGSCEENVITAASMGGLVTRYALAYMEKNNMNHQTRLYTSFDVPHLGANIPIGLQYATLFFAETGEVKAIENLRRINSEAARQLLIRHISKSYDGKNFIETNANCYRENLVTALNNIGWPEQIRKVAIANGNLSANGNGITNGTQIILWNYSTSTWGNKLLGYNFLAAKCELFAQGRPDHMVFNGVYTNPNPSVSLGFCLGIIYNVSVLGTNGPIIITIGAGGLVCVNIAINRFQRINNFNCGGVNCANLDGAPGGMNDGILSLWSGVSDEAKILGAVQPILHSANGIQGVSCFIPSVSALALSNPPNFTAGNYWYQIRPNNVNSEKPNPTHTPFDAFKGPEGIFPNEGHVFVKNDDWYGISGINSLSGYAGNIEWLAMQIEKSDYNLSASLPNPLTNTYNYGNRFQRKIRTISINNGGIVQVNGNYKTNFGAGTDEDAVVNSIFSLYTAGCGTQVTINSGGKFIIGDNNNIPNNNKALVYITAGSILRINSGGELKIHANSKLIIQKGAQLIIENGAIVNLLDANGALVIEGELKMEQNAIFATIGNGYVHFKKTSNSSPIITSVGNNTMHIKGNNNNNVSLLVEGGILNIPESLTKFKIEDAKCEFVNQSGLTIFSQGVEIANSNFNKTSTSIQKHKGIKVYGNPLGQNFNNVRIDNAETAITGHMEISVSSELNLNNVRFYDCGLALETIGGSFNWINGGAERCSTLVVAQASDGFNYIDNVKAYRSTITDYGTGINFTGGTNTYLQIQKSTIMGYDFNLRAYNVWLDLKCNSFLNSYTDEVYIENAILSSSVPMGTGYNLFKGQTWSLLTSNSTVYLNEGYSSFNSNGQSLSTYGSNTLSCSQPLVSNSVLANFNEWKGSLNNYFFDIPCFVNVTITDNNSINSLNQSYINARDAHCGFNTVGGGGGLGKTNANNGELNGNLNGENLTLTSTVNADTSIILNTTKFVNKTFVEAFQLTVTKFNSKDSLKNYIDIMNEFKAIVTSNNLFLTRNERIVKRNSYIKILHCLDLMVTKKKITVAANIAINSNITDIINLQNMLLSKTENDSTWMKWKFRINFDQALIFKMSEKNTIALQKLDSILLWNLDTNYTKLVNEWKCYINGEIALANKTVSTDSLKYFYPCYTHKPKPNLYLALQKSNFTNLALTQNTDEKSLMKLYPNPTKEFIILETIDKTQKPNNIQIFDILGKLVLDKMNTQMEGLNYKINVSNLSNGIYFMKTTFENEEYISKFIKE